MSEKKTVVVITLRLLRNCPDFLPHDSPVITDNPDNSNSNNNNNNSNSNNNDDDDDDDDSNNKNNSKNNDERISRAPFHVKHAQLR